MTLAFHWRKSNRGSGKVGNRKNAHGVRRKQVAAFTWWGKRQNSEQKRIKALKKRREKKHATTRENNFPRSGENSQ